ncbi:MAG: PAS domain S-box protein, partial [Pseudonocardiaceae bacterium]
MSDSGHQAPLAGVARAWSDAVGPLTEIPLPGESLEACLTDQLHRLIAALAQEPFTPAPAAQVAATLVERGLVREQCLERTVLVLGSALAERPELAAVDGLAGKVATLLGILAYGHLTARQRRTPEQSEAWFREVFDSAPVGILISDLDGTVTESNGALTELLHYPPATIAGHDISELFPPEDAAPLDSAYRALKDGMRGRFQGRVKARSGKGDTTWVSLTASVLRDAMGNPTHHVTMIEDVHDRQLLESRMRHQSLHDLLTGLPNRLHFGIYLEGLLEGEPDAAVMLYKINLDCFGIVNDGLGIGVGDLLLRSVASRLQALVAAEHAFLARFDADEFAIAIKESPATPNTATFAARINAELSEPVYLA